MNSSYEEYQEHIYYNVILSNTTNVAIPATITDNRNFPFINNPSNYQIAVERFSIPGNTIPLFIYDPVNDPIIMTFHNNTSGIDYEIDLIDPSSLPLPPVEIMSNGAYPNSVFAITPFLNLINYTIWNYIQDEINAGTADFVNAFPNLQINGAAVVDYYNQPLFEWDPLSSLIRFYAPAGGTQGVLVNVPNNFTVNTMYAALVHWELYLNKKGYEILGALPGVFWGFNRPRPDNHKVYQLTPKYDVAQLINKYEATDAVGNPISLGFALQVYAEDNQNYLWNKLEKVYVTTTMPVMGEYVPFSNGTLPVLTDFIPVATTDPKVNNVYQYFNMGNLKWVDFIGDQAILKIDFSFYYQLNGQIYQLMLNPGQTISLKFLIKRKEKI